MHLVGQAANSLSLFLLTLPTFPCPSRSHNSASVLLTISVRLLPVCLFVHLHLSFVAFLYYRASASILLLLALVNRETAGAKASLACDTTIISMRIDDEETSR